MLRVLGVCGWGGFWWVILKVDFVFRIFFLKCVRCENFFFMMIGWIYNKVVDGDYFVGIFIRKFILVGKVINFIWNLKYWGYIMGVYNREFNLWIWVVFFFENLVERWNFFGLELFDLIIFCILMDRKVVVE